MRSLLARAVAVLAVVFGVAFAAQGVASADDNGHGPITIDQSGSHAVGQYGYGNSGLLSGLLLFAPFDIAAVVDDVDVLSDNEILNDINVLSNVDED